MSKDVRSGSDPRFAPPEEEGMILDMEDAEGVVSKFEFLGMLMHDTGEYGFFFPVADESQVGGSGDILILRATEFDDEGQPSGFESIDDEKIGEEVYAAFQEATKDIYRFE
ncbi:MAG: DUF1292 domain-containing protein [Eggerthellaceae bacterium]|nr:DUF1292 domain-containing protein [Eggerthellaceae bacterium]